MIVKVCGLSQARNVAQVAALGVDLLGFIFSKQSPRCVTAGVAARASLVAGEAMTVGVFVDEAPATIVRTVAAGRLGCVQLHGHETPAQVERLRRLLPATRIIKAVGVASAADVERCKTSYGGLVDCFLFDTKCPAGGGSGRKYDWSVLEAYDGSTPFLLSGGIGPGDARQVRDFAHPSCVGIDVNSRFELAPGLKDVEKLKKFIEEIRTN